MAWLLLLIRAILVRSAFVVGFLCQSSETRDRMAAFFFTPFYPSFRTSQRPSKAAIRE